ncbi:MAG: hypothetical protein GVY16_04190 [Planctomycetes bacterium]|jgi:hypothetical protein|nr:hypothetical protein [Planctomycetota bacterium]
MKVQRWITPVVMAAVALTCLGVPAQAADESANQQLEAQINALKAEVAQLKAQQDESWLSERRAQEVKTLVRDVLSDAETRSSLMDSAVTAGHNGENFFISDEEGQFLFIPQGYVQVRYIANFQNHDENGTLDDEQAGFDLARTKFQGKGHVYGPQLRYFFSIDDEADTQASELVMEDYYVEYDLDRVADGLVIRGGRFRQPFLRENLIDASQQMAVERSLVNEFFNVDRSQGIMLAYSQDMWKAQLAWHNGTGHGEDGISDFTHVTPTGPAGYNIGAFGQGVPNGTDIALTARADIKLAGEWSQWQDFAAWDGEPMALFVGGAIDYQEAETGLAGPQWATVGWTLDASMEYQRMGVFLAGYGHHLVDSDNAPSANIAGATFPEWSNYGFQAMVNYQVLPNELEPFIRYELVMLDEDINNELVASGVSNEIDDNLNLVTMGVNWYGHKHDSKVTVDLVWALDAIDNPYVTNAAGDQQPNTIGLLGLQSDSPGNDGQAALRAQYQLRF